MVQLQGVSVRQEWAPEDGASAGSGGMSHSNSLPESVVMGMPVIAQTEKPGGPE